MSPNDEMSMSQMTKIVTRMAETSWVWAKDRDVIAFASDPCGNGRAVYFLSQAEFPPQATVETINEVTNDVSALITMVLNMVTQNPSAIKEGTTIDAMTALDNTRQRALENGFRLVKTDRQNG